MPSALYKIVLGVGLGLCLAGELAAAIHHAPVVIPGFRIRNLTRYPISSYRLFRTDAKGNAVPIPFQIDEINQLGDYVLPEGKLNNQKTGNGIFDLRDELVYMGSDVGPVQKPEFKKVSKPDLLYEIRHTFKAPPGSKVEPGAVYVGVYFRKGPDPVSDRYVVFKKKEGEIVTSRYRYRFDNKNYLVVNGVSMLKKDEKDKEVPLIDSSTFFMKADLKYFLTIRANHRSIDSRLEAIKSGPVRTIVRVGFFYTFLQLKFELGMYTEVSFFSNSVVLPAILYNPIDGPKSLNRGSGFYYGFATTDSPQSMNLQTNMIAYRQTSLLDWWRSKPKVEPLYWLSMSAPDRMMYVEIVPSKEMLADANVPYLYQENVSAAQMKGRDNNKALDLTKSPVNLGIFFDLTKFTEGEHRLSFKLFFENYFSNEQLESFKTLKDWLVRSKRMR